jgi:intracellular multiplication protein IcmB
MANIVNSFFNGLDSVLAWLSSSLKQTTESYCDIETADDEFTLVAYDGSLVSVIALSGVTQLIGNDEFEAMHFGLCNALQGSMKNPGHSFQFLFSYDRSHIKSEVERILQPAHNTAKRLDLKLDDLFEERADYFASYCAKEELYVALWTRPALLSAEQFKQAHKAKLKDLRDKKIPPLLNAQNFLASLEELRNEHDSFVRAIVNDFDSLGIDGKLLEVHDAVKAMRGVADPMFTDEDWKPVLPGDKIPVRDLKKSAGDVAELMWPPLGKQVIPRDCENIDLRTCRVGDQIYSGVFIDLFPQEVRPFIQLFNRTLPTQIPWRISFWVEGNGLNAIKFRSMIATILSFASSQNRLLSDAAKMLQHINVNSDDAVVKLKVSLATWAPDGDTARLRTRTAELAKALQGWGNCEVSEVCGDAFAGVVSSMLAVSSDSVATTSVAPLSDVIFMLPFTRPSSPWENGAVLLRSPDGKPWPFQPGSSKQTTWIDLFYARPGSGKSVLSNTINLAICLAPGIKALPHISIIDIGPSSSGLISLLREALPQGQQHLAAYHRLLMTPEYSINPFDTQLGNRHPTSQERSFLVNFLTLLATPLGSNKPYDGISDMAGLVVDELYKYFADEGSPRVYSAGTELLIDGLLDDIGFVKDEHTTWWEVTDALFTAGFEHEAIVAQRYAMPLLADAASICRTHAIEDLYGQVKIPTSETIIAAFGRMISSAVREYPILSRVTAFDLGDAKVVALDLDEIAKSGGDAADRQTAVMYMLARYVLARHYYLTEENVAQMPERYQSYHSERVTELKEVPKRIVYDEFHRTSKAQAVREQVILDMREGRKWNVQVALISQSLADYDGTMVEFATSIFIMDAGPAQTVKRSAEIFGLSETAQTALKTRVHGPREGGATFLAQFATKRGMNTQLLTSTIGPIELWAFSTTAEDASLRNKLYKKIGPGEARRLLARLFPGGTVRPLVEKRLAEMKELQGFIEESSNLSVVDQLVEEIVDAYKANPDVTRLPQT